MFLSQDVVALSGLTYRQVDYWTRKGILGSETPQPGSGHQRRYSQGQIQVAIMMGRLLRAGFDANLAVKCAPLLVQHACIQLGRDDDSFFLIRKIAVHPLSEDDHGTESSSGQGAGDRVEEDVMDVDAPSDQSGS